ncbi:MAG: SpoIIIAH-like family protein [Firmicutes bacterium]|nr:SpoIIIAH-like family protein [Bacillota bacterium]
MVKRQTVWLSTMMVLSLMLIGYYTLGTPPQSNTKSTTTGAGITTGVVGQSTGGTPAVPTTTNSGQALSGTSDSAQGSDWYALMSMDQQKHESALITTLQNTMASSRASSAEVNRAYQELTAIQTQTMEANRVHDLLLGQYPDSLTIFNPSGSVQVYVEAKSLTPEAAVEVINLVSQTLGISSNQVTVAPHA